MRNSACIIAIAALAFAAAPATAQIGFGVAGGPSTPVGSLSDVVNPGLHAGVMMDAGLPLLPFGLRAEAMFQRLLQRADGDHYDEFRATLNGRFDVLPLPLVGAYVTGGLGVYSTEFDPGFAINTGRRADTGFNIGVGAELNLFVVRPILEARFHRVLADQGRSYIPISVGFFF